MAQSRPLFTLLLVLALSLMAYAVAQNQQLLLFPGALLAGLAGLSLGGPLRWVGPLSYAAAFLGVLIMTKGAATPTRLSAALLFLVGLAWILLRERAAAEQLEWQVGVVRALRSGSERLHEAKSDSAIVKAGLDTIAQLKLAPTLAFVAYRQGTPYIVAAAGAYETFINKAIYPSENDSKSVQADHWVAEEVLALLKRDQRQNYYVSEVYGRDDTHLGLLILTRPTADRFTSEEKSVVNSFSRLLGAQLGQYQANRNLEDSNELTLRALGAALEHRDDETGGHTQRVVSLSVELARRLGWDESQVRALRWGAYLHDLGKIAIPDGVLHKRGPLDPAERRLIQTHTVAGYEMLQDLHFLPAETLDLVRYHHERWDGTGYPAGLRGNNIPEAARIFSIVDVYDALTNARPYKPAWTRERALQEIRKGAGQHFDPQYVEAFMRLMVDQDDVNLLR